MVVSPGLRRFPSRTTPPVASLLLIGVLAPATLLAPVRAVRARTFIVSPDSETFPTIQSAVDSAADQDTILVRSGTYVESVRIYGKSLHLLSEDGPGFTGLTSPDPGKVCLVLSGTTGLSTIRGFRVSGGIVGIYVADASVEVSNNIISNNQGSPTGGGISLRTLSYDVNPPHWEITGNFIHDNDAVYQGGGYM